MLSAASKIPFEADELLAAGGWQETPLRVTQAKTVPLMVPADAEYVIEGYVPPHVMEEEGPFGEFTDGYVAKAPNNVMQVTAITPQRCDLPCDPAGGTEDSTLLGGRCRRRSTSAFRPSAKSAISARPATSSVASSALKRRAMSRLAP